MSCYSTKRKKLGVKCEIIANRHRARGVNLSVELPSRYLKNHIFLDKPCNCAYGSRNKGKTISPYEKRIARILFSIYSQRRQR